MKKLILSVYSLLFIAILSSCNGTGKSKTNQSDANSTSSTAPIDQPQGGLKRQISENQANDSLTGAQIVDSTALKMNGKLGLSEQQSASLKQILTKALLRDGEELENKYSFEQSIYIGQRIKQSSVEAIMAILDAGQKEKFEKFLNRK